MLHSGTLNNEINLLHERAQRIVYSDYKSSFNTILEKDGSFSIHHRNIQSLAKSLPLSSYYGRHYKIQQASCIKPKNSPGTI